MSTTPLAYSPALPLALALGVFLSVSGCSPGEEKPSEPAAASSAPAAAPSAATAPAEDRPAKIPLLEGYKYYVGGPVMRQDPYGRFRITDFQGEVAQPPSRGMVFGVKREGDRWEYRVWGNGILLGVHKGFYRDLVFWQDYVEGYRDQKLVARQYFTYKDDEKRVHVKNEDIDPATGEVIRVTESNQSYLPAAMPQEIEENPDLADDDDAPAPAGDAKPAAGQGE